MEIEVENFEWALRWGDCYWSMDHFLRSRSHATLCISSAIVSVIPHHKQHWRHLESLNFSVLFSGPWCLYLQNEGACVRLAATMWRDCRRDLKKDVFCLLLCVCVCMHVCGGTHRGQKSMPGPSKLELQVAVNLLMWVMGTEQWSSKRAIHALNCWAMSPASVNRFF